MSDLLGPNSLAATRHYVLVLRLVLGPSQRDVYGEVLDPETGKSDAFVGLTGLGLVLGGWLKDAERSRIGAPDRQQQRRTRARRDDGGGEAETGGT